MNMWWTADRHFGHGNIIKYCMRRQFMNKDELLIMIHATDERKNKLKISQKSLDKMNEVMTRNHNERVKNGDIVFDLGDFCFRNSFVNRDKGEGDIIKSRDYEKKLNGKIILVQGNHDNNNSTKTPIKYMKIKFGGKDIKLIHNPKHDNMDCEMVFCGHVHQNWKFKRIKNSISKRIYYYLFKGLWIKKHVDYINVGVDQWNFKPVSFNEVNTQYSRWRKQNDS